MGVELGDGAACGDGTGERPAVGNFGGGDGQAVAFEDGAGFGDFRGTERAGRKDEHGAGSSRLDDFNGATGGGKVERCRSARNNDQIDGPCYAGGIGSGMGRSVDDT